MIEKLKSLIGKEDEFLRLIENIRLWDFPKISLWAFEEILNYLDILLNINKEKETNLIIILKFIRLLLSNTNNKDIFSSFDHFSDIITNSINLTVKTCIIEIYMIYNGVKKSLIDNFLNFADHFNFVISVRPLFTDYLLGKYSFVNFYSDVEKLFSRLLKDAKLTVSTKSDKVYRFEDNDLKNLLKSTHKSNLVVNLEKLNQILEGSLDKDTEDQIFYHSLRNFFILYANMNTDDYNTLKETFKFILNIINLSI